MGRRSSYPNIVNDYRTFTIKDMKKALGSMSHYRGGWYWHRDGKEVASIGVNIVFNESDGYIVMNYSYRYNQGEPKTMNYTVKLIVTPCNFGGKRWWFLCPKLGKKCSKLYLGTQGMFVCRQALGKVYYEKQIESKRMRSLVYSRSHLLAYDKLLPTIKYKYRKGIPTKKYAKFLKIMYDEKPTELLQQQLDDLIHKIH